jgi:fructoselysine-6-P-deglycase FrlB-like protein
MAVRRVRIELLHRDGGGSVVGRPYWYAGASGSGLGVAPLSRIGAGGRGRGCAVVISRSGQTSETCAAQLLEREKNIRVLAVTGTSNQPLEQSATATLPLLLAMSKAP